MPELPEVETVRTGLAPVLTGARLERVETRRADLRFPFPQDFVQTLTGARIEAVERRAKYLLFRLDRGQTWVTHLGMTGRFLVSGATLGVFHRDPEMQDRHTHVRLDIEDGATVGYHDTRRFGFMGLVDTATLSAHPWFANLGPEPFSADFDPAHLQQMFDGRRQPVKGLLLDQRTVAGLGNIYVCEALFRAAVAPDRPAGDLSKAEIKRLHAEVLEVLNAAITAGGSTLRDFRHSDGALGYFQHRFQVYDREGEACLRQGCAGHVARIVQSGRSSFFCRQCQA